jgi:hypothetical protein
MVVPAISGQGSESKLWPALRCRETHLRKNKVGVNESFRLESFKKVSSSPVYSQLFLQLFLTSIASSKVGVGVAVARHSLEPQIHFAHSSQYFGSISIRGNESADVK